MIMIDKAKKHPAHPPSPYVTMQVSYGSEYKHLYRQGDWDVTFHPTRADAQRAAREAIEADPNMVIALLKVDELIAAKIEVQTVAIALGDRPCK